MVPRRFPLVLALALTACTPPGTTIKPPATPKPSVKAVATPPANPGAGIISDQGGVLVGVVRAPAGIIANHGAGIVANNGGGLVTDNGAGVISDAGGAYRLAALAAQVPVAGVTVTLEDAAGRPVRGAGGQPLAARTDARGAYRFPAGTVLPARNLVARAQLSGGQGALLAVVPAGSDGRKADLELVSTLTTGYILQKYVRDQADPLATLDRLPAAVEAETRARAQAAVDARPDAAPATVTEAAVAGAVEALKADAAFGAQLEAVRKLLILAGQSELGEGQAATEVLMSLHGALPLPDGGVYLPSWFDRRIWKVDARGVLTRVAGRGGQATAGADGQVARDVGLGAIQGADVDSQGRLVFTDLDATGRLWRVEPDGKLKLLRDFGHDIAGGVACAPDGKLHVLVTRHGIMGPGELPDAEDGSALITLDAAGQELAVLERTPLLDALGGMGLGDPLYRGPQGQLWACSHVYQEDGQETLVVAELDLATGTAARLPAPTGGTPVAFDRTGTWYLQDAAGALVAVAPAGVRTTVLAAVPKDLDATRLQVDPGPGGALYLTDYALCYRVQGGAATRVAGLPPDAAGTGPGASVDPAGLAVLPDGAVLAAETDRKRILRIAADGTSTVAVAAGLAGPQAVARDGLGGLWIPEGRTIKRWSPDGQLETVYAEGRDEEAWLTTAWGGPDGTGWWVVSDGKSYQPTGPGEAGVEVAWLYRRAPGGQPVQVLAFTDDADERAVRTQALLIDAQGAMHRVRKAGADARLEKLVGTAWQAVGKAWPWPTAVSDEVGPEGLEQAAFDAQGRVVYGWPGTVGRGDPATGQAVVLAGAGGRVFTGAGGDDDTVGGIAGLAVGPNGDVYFADRDAHQVRRIPAGKI